MRAAGFGAAAAFVLGGLFVLYQGLVATYGAVDCAGMSVSECAAVHESAKTVGRVQVIAGGALVTLGTALFLFLRRAPTAEGGASP